MSDFSEWISKNRALWTRVYDEVIAPDIQKEWEKRDEAHKKELKQKEENQQILFNHVDSQVVKNSCLSSENEELKEQLELLYNDVPATSGVQPNLDQQVSAHSSVAADEHGQLVLRYDELSKKYQDLSQKIKYLERKNTAVMQKNKDMKDSVRAWQEYADRQAGKQKAKHEARSVEDWPRLSAVPLIDDARPHIPSSPLSVAAFQTPPACTDGGRSSPAPMPPLASTELVDPDDGFPSGHNVVHDEPAVGDHDDSTTPRQTNYGRLPPQQSAHGQSLVGVLSNADEDSTVGGRLRSHLCNNPSSSQTTEDEGTQQATRSTTMTTGTYDDDDKPQFVSARSLKRKRGQPLNVSTYGHPSSDGTPIKPFRVKEEPASSPSHAHSLLRKDTIDLDDPISTLLKTPRHTKRNDKIVASTTNASGPPRSSSAPFSQTVKQEQGVADVIHDTSDALMQTNHAGSTDAEIRARSAPYRPIDNVSNVLRHLDPNVVTPSQEEVSNKRAKRIEGRSKSAHGIFAESGEEQPILDENTNRLSPSAARARINRNLQSPHPAPANFQETSSTTTGVKLEHSPTSSSPPRPVQTSLSRRRLHSPTTDGRPQWTMKAQQPRQSVRKPPGTRQADNGPIRSKAPTELTRQDFKPNPRYNQGYTHAFSETMRKRGDRMCLPGCTNPECCGSSFRTFAEAMAPLPPSQEEALLEDYLGEAYDDMNMTQMSSEERQELVLQARTRKIAKETGKHRETYERRRTPPGFWRVDFPTTQEQQEDREKAEEQERQIVRERWLDAQRKGGRWIFRDE